MTMGGGRPLCVGQLMGQGNSEPASGTCYCMNSEQLTYARVKPLEVLHQPHLQAQVSQVSALPRVE